MVLVAKVVANNKQATVNPFHTQLNWSDLGIGGGGALGGDKKPPPSGFGGMQTLAAINQLVITGDRFFKCKQTPI